MPAPSSDLLLDDDHYYTPYLREQETRLVTTFFTSRPPVVIRQSNHNELYITNPEDPRTSLLELYEHFHPGKTIGSFIGYFLHHLRNRIPESERYNGSPLPLVMIRGLFLDFATWWPRVPDNYINMCGY